MVSRRWILAPPAESGLERVLAEELRVPEFAARLLCQRGLGDPDAARAFLSPRLKNLSDPFLLPDMRPAVTRIFRAIDRGERIVLFGDYDVDGVTSLALLTRMLRAYGAAPVSFLPVRMDEGYGLSHDGVERCVEHHRPQLLIALDCGTTAVAEIRELRHAGIDVLVFDHHECKQERPECHALVNPKLGSGFDYLCTAGVVFKLCHALLKERRLPELDLREYLDLAAMATVADLVPLCGENRTLVAAGLRQMERTRWIGLQALREVAGVRAPIQPVDVGFRLGPRLNAAGRLGTAEAALELLLTEDRSRARTLATALDMQNRERQLVERRTVLEVEEQVRAWFQPDLHAAIVAGAPGWHPGVVGIVASRIAKQFHRPTLVIGFDEDGTGKGSGRSIEGFSLVEGLGRCAGSLEKFGGHEMAAGLTIRQERLVEFKEGFLQCAAEMLSAEQLQPRVMLDCELELSDITFDMLTHHDLLEPFGIGNAQPVFLTRGVAPASEPTVLKEKHLRIDLRRNGTRRRAIFFNGAQEALPRPPWDIAFRLERNEYRGAASVQMEILCLRASEPL